MATNPEAGFMDFEAMKILFISDLFPPHFVGGYELKCKLHAEELARRGHQTFILTSRWMASKKTPVEKNVFRSLYTSRETNGAHSPTNLPALGSFSKRYKQLKQALACRVNYKIAYKVVENLKPAVVYVWQMDDVSIAPVLAAQDQGVPTVFRLDDYWLSNLRKKVRFETNWIKRRYREIINGLRDFDSIKFDHMLVVSRWVMNTYVEIGFDKKNITVLPEGVPSNIIIGVDNLVSSKPGSPNRLVYVGRLVHQKGTHVAIEAVAHLTNNMDVSNVCLDIIGVGPNSYVEQLRNLAKELGVDDRVEFVGFIDHQQVLARFAEYDAVLIPSLWEEPLSGTIAEAMARGLPVIATDRGGNPEIISDGKNGLLVPPDDSIQLANAIFKLLKSPSLSDKIRHEALKTVQENYVHEQIVEKVEKYFQRILVPE